MQVYQQLNVDIVPPAYDFIKNETRVQVFSYEFCKIFKNTFFVEHLRRVASNDMIIVRFFCKICSSLKWKKT